MYWKKNVKRTAVVFLLFSHPQKKIPFCLSQLLYFLTLCLHKRHQEQIELVRGLKLIHQTDKHVTEKKKKTIIHKVLLTAWPEWMQSERHLFTTHLTPLLTWLYLLCPFRWKPRTEGCEEERVIKFRKFTKLSSLEGKCEKSDMFTSIC